MPLENRGTFHPEDVTLLLNDITGLLEPKSTEEREKLIQSGVHYSEMLPLEYRPSERYLAEYSRALDSFAGETADAVVGAAEKIYARKGGEVVLVSLARAGTPIGILIKRYLRRRYGVNAPHYTISMVRGRGIDKAAMRYILDSRRIADVQFIDGWTGKGAILRELSAALVEFTGGHDDRKLLAVLADPANITDMCGTHEDIPIASSFLNATVCGLMSRTVVRLGIGEDEFHGVAFFEELRADDKTYEFIERIESRMGSYAVDTSGYNEARQIAEKFGVADINFVKPGIGEATRVLLRRMPDMILIAEDAEPRYISHIIQLAEEKHVPVIRYPLRQYKACGIIKALTISDL
ncbi:MAG: cysteine protease StiP family protein [Synergistaceae bacterium]|nr:cysteine protease StiP family protein [Synergistaceae bacterium]